MTDALLEKLLNSKKYGDICPDTVRRVWAECLGKHKKPKDAEQAAREALHGIAGAFMTPQEARHLAWDMQAWYVDKTDFGLERMLSRHASTRERLPIASMDALYNRIFATVGRPQSVLDLACGINPLYLGARGIKTTGVDISGQAVALVNAFASNYGMPVQAVCADLLTPGAVPQARFDLALMFKLLPLLERQRKGAAVEIMDAVNAEFLAVSFPTRTLGGGNVGMATHYAEWMVAHPPSKQTIVDSFETENELFYILKEY